MNPVSVLEMVKSMGGTTRQLYLCLLYTSIVAHDRNMSGVISQLLAASPNLKVRIFGLYGLLIGVNIAAWIWALAAFHSYPLLLGTSLLAYTFGLRHAVDADHIAAIDNVTRKLMQQGQKPVGVGFFFSLGHSTIVFGLSAAIALTSVALKLSLIHI